MSACDMLLTYFRLGESVALLVARWTNNRNVAGSTSRPTKVDYSVDR